MTTKAKSKAVKFTKEEEDAIGRAARRVWEYIGCDVLNSVREFDGREFMRRAEVIEMVVDANRLTEIGKLDKALEDRIYSMELRAQNRLFAKFFPFKTYGF